MTDQKVSNESTRRALRTLLQAVAAVAAFMVAVAIPPVQEGLNSLLDALGIGLEVTPGLVAAIGAIGAALTSLVSKLQNLYEGRDQVRSPDQLASEVVALAGLVSALVVAAREAGVEVEQVIKDSGVATVEVIEE